MGNLIGHVLPGLAFFLLGLWHLFNQIKLHTLRPNSYASYAWFPAPSKLRHLELLFIMVGSSISVSMELFIGPEKHQPFDVDGTIPSNHLRNFEHSSISMYFFVYAALAIILDRIGCRSQHDLTQLLAAIAFGQQLLVFHLHSTDHKGLEGQYHLLLQILVSISLGTTLIGMGLPRSFMVSFVRSLSIIFQGVWLLVMGFMLWTPELIPKGCLLHSDDGHIVVTCASEEALDRAKSLANILFSWLVIGMAIFAACSYLVLVEIYGRRVGYSALAKENEEPTEESNDLEPQKINRFDHYMGNGFATLDIER